MAKNNNLSDFLTDVGNAIRTAEGTFDPIDPQDFSDRILALNGDLTGARVAEDILNGSLVGMRITGAPYTVNLASGSALSTIDLSGYSVTYQFTTSDTAIAAVGTLAFKTPSEVPAVGTHQPILVFTPTDPTLYTEGATTYEIWDALNVVVS